MIGGASRHQSSLQTLQVCFRYKSRYCPVSCEVQLIMYWGMNLSRGIVMPSSMNHRDRLLQIDGYHIGEQVYAGSRTLVYRAVRLVDQQPVILKILKRDRPTLDEILRLYNHYTIAKNLNFSGISQHLNLEPYSHGYALVTADQGFSTLQEYLALKPLILSEFLAIAIQLADILHYLYQQRIIHKDLKPANILIDPVSQQIQLTDFSIATLLPKETEEIKHPNVLEGTLAYMAPEQTGRMNRGIDYRSDFYALGITFFEMLTGELPYQTDDLLELMHCHLAKPIPKVRKLRADIPIPIEQIVTKLMAKNAEDRYQSALGLKYDLELALDQLNATGTIIPFAIASRDRSDRLIIPEKIYGRESEIRTLLNAFERVSQGNAELMLIAGSSGIGKTFVVNEVHKPIAREHGYFIKGKFDQFNRNIPLSALVQAVRDLLGQLMSESDAQLNLWKAKILKALGENAQVIMQMLPELERIIGEQPPVTELSGNAAQNRFNLLFQKFIQVFTTPEHPLVIFLDDLQWADWASLQLLKLLMQDVSYLLVLGAYRDHEVTIAHPLMLTLRELDKLKIKINTITLQPLIPDDINQLVADTLSCDRDLAQPLTELVYQKTQGNPFFTTQFLKTLHQDGCIQFNRETGYWQCDLSQIKVQSLTDDVVVFMAQQLQKLSPNTQSMLKLAACIGSQFDLQTLAIVSSQSGIETAMYLWQALQEGFLVPLNQIYNFFQPKFADNSVNIPEFWNAKSGYCSFRFLHDRVQQAAYSLIPKSQKSAVHLNIGRLLLNRYSSHEQELQLFHIVNQFNCGIALIDQAQEREEIAYLNWRAGKKARAASAYAAAMSYLKIGIQLLSAQCWQHQYDLSLGLHQLAAEVAYLAGIYTEMSDLIAIGLQQARNQLDRVKFYEIQILAMVAQNQAHGAIAYARQVLPHFGVQIPHKPSKFQTILGFFTTVYRMMGTSPQDLLALPSMSDPDKLAACNLFNAVGAAAQSSVPEILPFMTFIGVAIYLRYGNIPKSSMAYTIYAFLLCEKLGQIEQGYAIGKAAIALCYQQSSKEALAPTLFLWTRFIAYRKEPLQSVLPLLMEAYQVSLEVGDTEYAAYSLCVYFTQAYWTSQNLMDLQREAIASRPALQKLQQLSMLEMHDLNCQILDNLTTKTDQAWQITGQFFDETTIPKSDRQLQVYTSLRKLQLALLFEQYALAREQIAIIESMLSIVDGTFVKTLIYFYDALVRLAQYPYLKPKQQRSYLHKIITTRKYLAKFAQSAPMNYQHKVALVEAERLRVVEKFHLAGDWYDRAIAGAKSNGYLQEEALANELAAKFYLALGKEKIAQVYMHEAYYAYARWGATAKVIDLENRYPQLFVSLRLQTDVPRVDQKLSLESCYQHSTLLDLETLLKASQAISREIELDKLLETLLNVLIANAGADKCVLLLQQNQNLQMVAIAKSEQQPQILTTPIPLETSNDVPIGVINWVKRSLETLVLNDARANSQFIGDRYVIQNQPKSMLCSPILKQGQLLGILYLENRLTVGAFTSDRLEILNLLCTQAAISLENAQLYSTLEQKVAEQTQELSQALTYQQSTQQELIHSEKMAALGQLIASIAHEINTPLGVIRSATSNIVAANHVTLQQLPRIMQSLSPQQQQEFQALIHVALQSHQSLSTREERQLRRQLQSTLLDQGIPNAIAISTQLSQMQIVADLQHYLAILQDPRCEQILQVAYALVMQHHSTRSIQQEVDRAAKIVFALKAYSHNSHDGEQILAKVTDSIEVVLTLYHNRLKQKIEVIRLYDDDVPEILCNPDELTQVWVNLIDNAIYAMGDGGTLEIAIATQEDYVVVAIADSGCGITPESQSKIFEPFFTSKPRGEGSGLGLDIVRQIVQKHQGKIQVQSGSDRTVFTVFLPLPIG